MKEVAAGHFAACHLREGRQVDMNNEGQSQKGTP